MVPAVHTRFETGIPYRTQRMAFTLADVGAGQEAAVEPRAQAVVLQDRCARDLAQKAWAQYAQNGATGMVWPEAEQEARLRFDRFQRPKQVRHTFPRTAPGVHVDLECDAGHLATARVRWL